MNRMERFVEKCAIAECIKLSPDELWNKEQQEEEEVYEERERCYNY